MPVRCMVLRRTPNWNLQMNVKATENSCAATKAGKRALGGGVELLEQAFDVSQPFCSRGMFKRLVLGENVHETLAHVVAMLGEKPPASVAKTFDDVAHLACGSKRVRHSAAVPACARRPGGQAR